MFKRFRRWWFKPTATMIGFHILCEFRKGFTKLQEMMMTTQEKIDGIADAITVSVANIRQDIADLKAANPAADFSKLEASVSGLAALDAENPAPPPVP